MLYNKIQVLCSCIFYLFICLVYRTCLRYTVFLAGGIYAQSIQSAQIEFNAINMKYVPHVIIFVIHVEDCNYLLFCIHIYHFYSLIKLINAFYKLLLCHFTSYLYIIYILFMYLYIICKFFMNRI